MRDVAIVGGSAVGFFTAQLLARRGLRVRVFEGSDQLAPARRTLIVTNRMRHVLGPLGERAIVNEIRRFELYADGRAASISLQRADLVVERSTLIQGLAEQAAAVGCQVILGRRFLKFEPCQGGLTLVMEQGPGGKREEISTKTVVGADGAVSRVARAGGWPTHPTVPIVQAIVRLPRDLPPNTARVWFVPEDTPYFYWMIPESATRGALGVIGEEGRAVRHNLERFLDKRGFEPLEFQGGRIPAYRRWIPVHRRVGAGDVYLVGDAAGQVKVTTIGGVVTGFRGAVGVAEAIATGRAGRELGALRRELNLHLLVRRVLHSFRQDDYERLFDLLETSAGRSLSCYTRDEAAKILLRLCLRRPGLLLMGLRAFVRRV